MKNKIRKQLFKVKNSLHKHIPIFNQPKSYSCDVGVCEQTNLKEWRECHSISSITKQRMWIRTRSQEKYFPFSIIKIHIVTTNDDWLIDRYIHYGLYLLFTTIKFNNQTLHINWHHYKLGNLFSDAHRNKKIHKQAKIKQ